MYWATYVPTSGIVLHETKYVPTSFTSRTCASQGPSVIPAWLRAWFNVSAWWAPRNRANRNQRMAIRDNRNLGWVSFWPLSLTLNQDPYFTHSCSWSDQISNHLIYGNEKPNVWTLELTSSDVDLHDAIDSNHFRRTWFLQIPTQARSDIGYGKIFESLNSSHSSSSSRRTDISGNDPDSILKDNIIRYGNLHDLVGSSCSWNSVSRL